MNYTLAALEDELLKAFLTSKKNQRFYYAQAEYFIRRINVYKPLPIFVLHTEDIPEGLVKELAGLDDETARDDIITNVVRRIYQSVDPDYFAINGIWAKVKWHLMEGYALTHPLAGLSGGGDASDDDDETADYADQLIDSYKLKTLRDTKKIYRYDKKRGIFVGNAEIVLEARIEADLGMPYFDDKGKLHESDLSTGQVNEYLNHIRRRTYINRDDFNPSIEWLACKNCMVNLLTGETTEFNPSFLCTTQIPVKYDYEYLSNQIADFFILVEYGGCQSRIMSFLNEIMSPGDVCKFLDFMAYCLWREYKFNFWLLLHGAGFNGKSILLNLIEALLGKDNVSGETLDRLLHERFAVGNLFHKMANVDADVSADVILDNTGIIKKLTGNDVHTGEYKFKDPFKFVNHAKLIFSCNRIPETEDQTDAFYRRPIIINLTTQFFGDKEDFDLISKLTTDQELTILLHQILPRVPRILKEGLRKTTNESIAETYDKYTKGSNPVKAFYEKAVGPEAGGKVPKLEMIEHYYKFCREFALTPESDQSFSRKLSNDFGLKTRQYRLGSERVRCWIDVKLRDWKAEQEEADRNLQDLRDYSETTKEAMR